MPNDCTASWSRRLLDGEVIAAERASQRILGFVYPITQD
jgi:hypothetical protein